MQINTNEESFAWLIHENIKRNFDTISEITVKDIDRQAIKVMRYITDTDEVQRHYQSVLRKKASDTRSFCATLRICVAK
jgi:hypothetical protein